jgi:hypothetical protein
MSKTSTTQNLRSSEEKGCLDKKIIHHMWFEIYDYVGTSDKRNQIQELLTEAILHNQPMEEDILDFARMLQAQPKLLPSSP